MPNLDLFDESSPSSQTLVRLEEMLGSPIPKAFFTAFADLPNPDVGLANLERWLNATTNPALHFRQLVALPSISRWLIRIFALSQDLSDTLIQNPEFSSIVLDPRELARMPTRAAIKTEAESLLLPAINRAHRLDRLRYLKQRWTVPVALNDLAGAWSDQQVWTALSTIADALIESTQDLVWSEMVRDGKATGTCPVMIVAFGKLGGAELNYSSDIDLVYVMPDGRPESEERVLIQFCEAFGRAISDRMGRGSLYRIDLRLRPYGNAGPILSSMRAVEAYYSLYAESWEVQALIRSRPVTGGADLMQRWETMRLTSCFRPVISELEIESMLAMKSRIAERSIDSDIKRGAGGIRDIEFYVQAMQLINGHDHDQLRCRSTLDALEAIDKLDLAEHAVVSALESGYRFLRQLEHRGQMVGDLQTHSIPEGEFERRRLSSLMGRPNWAELERELAGHRRAIHSLYRTLLAKEEQTEDSRAIVAERSGALAPTVLQWFESLPMPDAFFSSLAENKDSLDRVLKLAEHAPRLIVELRNRVSLSEMAMSGEIEEEWDASSALESARLDLPIEELARRISSARTRLLCQYVLQPGLWICGALAGLMDAVLRHCAKRLDVEFDIIGLGSLGSGDVGPDSDADLLLLVTNPDLQSKAETQAQKFLGLILQLKRSGSGLDLDLRLRPDGGKGLMVRSHDAFRSYELEGMEMWERFALGSSRLVYGSEESLDLALKIAYAQPLSPPRLRELLEMKKRVETERVNAVTARREIKLGYGSLSDIEWLVHLNELRYPSATHAAEVQGLSAKIRNLGQVGLLNSVEVEQILDARDWLVNLRFRIYLLGLEKDILPENPGKLDRLAASFGLANGNELLARHQRTTELVRALYLQNLERLKA